MNVNVAKIEYQFIKKPVFSLSLSYIIFFCKKSKFFVSICKLINISQKNYLYLILVFFCFLQIQFVN